MAKDGLKFDNGIDRINPGISHLYSFEFSKHYIRNKNLLNVGCWIGNYEFLLKEFPCDIVSLETEMKPIIVAKETCSHVRFIQGSILNPPFSNESFDIVMMWLVLEHLPQGSESLAFSEAKRILKNNGYFIFSTPNYHWLNNILDPAFSLFS